MKTYKKVAISIVAGLLAMALSSAPMWWGVLFSPITRDLACAPLTEDAGEGPSWESGGVVLRLKSLDFLLSLFQSE